MLKGKTVLLGVCGGIAAYKIANLASMLIKAGAKVHVLMTKNAANFIHPITFETITSQKCIIDTFDRDFEFKVEHIALAKEADVFLIAPATANTIAKISCGIADDMLTTTFLASKAPKLVAPAMNTQMYENPITQENIKRLGRFGIEVIEPASGRLACGDEGKGKMPEAETLFSYIEKACCIKDLQGKHILVTAGPTKEAIDPVRFISNHSSGKMGYAIAKQSALRGAEVTLVSGPVNIKAPDFVKTVFVENAREMFEEVIKRAEQADIVIKAAAVADYRPQETATEKLKKKKGEGEILLTRTQDILAYLGVNKKEGQLLCGFSMETENMIENSKRKLEKKNLDMIVANNVKVEGAGFQTDTNIATFIDRQGMEELPKMTKLELADKILNRLLKLSKT